jgi:CelD/BcsL family acetyltransferase involved in cellulose biosynthesis
VGAVCHNDDFAHPACRAFLLDVCERFAARGELRIFRLYLDKKFVASRLGFALGGCLYLYYSGIDPAYARYGVGTIVVAEAMKHAIGEGLSAVNLSTGKDPSKLRWRPREIVFREALVVSPRALGRAKYHALLAAERAMDESAVGRYARRLLSRRAPPRSAELGMAAALVAFVKEGREGLISYVDSSNLASLKSFHRMGFRGSATWSS